MNIFSRFMAGIANPSLIKKYMEEGASLVDVRTHVEFREGSLPNAVNIPLDAILSKLPELEKMGKIIVFCKSGMRSKMALQFMKANSSVDAINAGSYDHLAHSLKNKN